MSTTIPQTDADLLAAQAAAGQDGVAAYEAAKKAMAEQRARAVSDAMAAAEGRGAPAAAMESALAQVNQMYDRRDASLTNAETAYRDMLASRDRRMIDYSGAVGEARSLIGDQAARAVAPIDAQTRYAVANIEAQSRREVDAINAQMRLKELEMQAAAAAAARRGGGGGGGGGSTKKPSLTQSELAAGVTARATSNLQRARDTASAAMRQTAEQSRQAGSYTAQSIQYDTRQRMLAAQAAQQRARQNAEMARQGASYAARAAQEWQRNNGTPVASVSGGVTMRNGQVSFPDLRMTSPPSTPMARNPALDATRSAYEQAAAQLRRANNPPRRTTQANPIAEALRVSPLLQPGQSFFTPTQIDAMAAGPDASIYNAMLGMGGLQRIGELDERLGFQATDPSARPDLVDAAGMTPLNPAAAQAMRAALWQAGVDMEAEGYKIDPNELQNVLDSGNDIYKPGDTYLDVQSRRAGGDGYNETRERVNSELTEAEKASADAEWEAYTQNQRMRSDQEEANNRAAEEALVQTFGLAPSVPGLSPVQVAALLEDEDNFAAFQGLLQKLDEYRTGGMKWDDVEIALRSEYLQPGDPVGNAFIAILEQFY